jgi:hypothetical protein
MIFRKQKHSLLVLKTIGQAKIAGGIIEHIINENNARQSGYSSW